MNVEQAIQIITAALEQIVARKSEHRTLDQALTVLVKAVSQSTQKKE